MSYKTTKTFSVIFNLFLVFTMAFSGSAQITQARVWTEPLDYAPGATVTIRGDNSDGALYQAGETISVEVTDPYAVILAPLTTLVQDDGNGYLSWAVDLAIPNDATAAGTWTYKATAGTSGVTEHASFTVTAPVVTDVPTEVPTEAPVVTEEPVAPTEAPVATEAPTAEPTVLATATITSDKADYAAGSLVTLTGTNWQGDTQVKIYVNDDLGQIWYVNELVTVLSDGTIIDTFSLPTWFVASYFVIATGQQTGRVATTTFTDADASPENLWQCDPPDTYNRSTYTCESTSSTGWATGNDNGPFTEGETVPYRTRLNNLVVNNNYSITIEWDTTR